jgi:predicted PurR-regulated permease PerM
LDQKYVDRVTAMTRAMVKGIFVIAVAQGVIAGLFFWIAGVKYAIFWMVLAIFFSILPLGANVIAIPIGIVLLVIGDIWQGVLVILGSVFIVSNIDNLLRPRLVAKEAELNSALVLLSAFGGLKLFGFLGVVYGPVIMIFLVTTVEIYLEHYRQIEEAQ